MREMRDVSSHVSFKMQGKNALRHVVDQRFGAVLERVPATLPMCGKGPAELQKMGTRFAQAPTGSLDSSGHP